MLQFYFLSVLLNALTGILLVFAGKDVLSGQDTASMPSIAYDETVRLVLGILTAVTGFFKLLTVIRGDIPVIGDLIPALAGLAAGTVLLYEFYRSRTHIEEDSLPSILLFIVHSDKYIGIAAIISSVLHFFFPYVLFL